MSMRAALERFALYVLWRIARSVRDYEESRYAGGEISQSLVRAQNVETDLRRKLMEP